MSQVPFRRRATVAVATTAAAAAAATFSLAAPSAATASTNAHAYRHGLVPTFQSGARETYNGHTAGPGGHGGGKNLRYGGGVGGIGVTTGGSEKVYLVFYGSGWGTASGSSTLSFSNDTAGLAGRIQSFFSNLGGTEQWSNVMTQYCEGVAAGTTSCAGLGNHVAYPSQKGVLSGVWYDNTNIGNSPTATQLAAEAVTAAAHFNNTTAASNRTAQYVILSPKGSHPDGFNTPQSSWCAWHDYTGDGYGVNTSASGGDVAFSNDPYILDLGASCGANFVHKTGGALDGVTIVFGHEYAETITDQFPAGGWTDIQGAENADKCAWISSGQGASADVDFNGTKFPVQSTWSNATGNCLLTNPTKFS